MKNSQQLKDLIKNMTKETGINPQILITKYMIERLLERLSVSKYKDRFILKGGMLISSIIGYDLRSTMDVDTTIKSIPLSEENLHNIFNEITKIKIDDNVSFKIKSIRYIREESEYGGMRVSIDGIIDKTIIPFKVDVTTGDAITPKEIEYDYELMLEDKKINLYSYNIETILAEKIETLISRGITNTRIRDFYDIHIIYKTQDNKIDYETLNKAIEATFKNRETSNMLEKKDRILNEVINDEKIKNLWNNYQKEYPYAKLITWVEINKSLINIFRKI
jgi:predicted nucleotidyltransferase component of viral defense system